MRHFGLHIPKGYLTSLYEWKKCKFNVSLTFVLSSLNIAYLGELLGKALGLVAVEGEEGVLLCVIGGWLGAAVTIYHFLAL